MTGPPYSDMRRGAAANDTPEKSHQDPHQLSEAASDLQAEKIRRLYSFCRATACTIAALAFAVCPR